MNCNICDHEFKYIEGLKFCPYCGSKLNIQFVASNVDEGLKTEVENYTSKEVEESTTGATTITMEETFDAAETKENKLHDTLEMPPITEEDIKKDRKLRRALKRAQKIAAIKSTLKSKMVIIPFSAVIVLAIAGFLGYKYLGVKYVDEAQIRKDLIGKIIVLPKGTNFEITNGSIRNLAVASRNFKKEDGLEYIDLNTTLNNNTLEVKGTLLVSYKKEEKNQWKISDKIEIKEKPEIKAVAGMSETVLMPLLKEYKIEVSGEEIALGDDIVKDLKIVERRPEFDAGKEEIVVGVSIDSGILSAEGNINAALSFSDEVWKVETVQRASESDFKTTLSPSLSEEPLLEQIKKKSVEGQVAHASVFGGKSFLISDKFTKSMKIGDKSYDESNGNLKVTITRENTAGVLKSTLSADYVFDTTLKDVTLSSSGKSKLEGVSVLPLTEEQIRNSLAGTEIEGKNEFFWWSDNHKVLQSEAKTFHLDEALSKSGYANIKYVYGQITYKDGGNSKATSIVALYYLVYNNSSGYVWKLDSVIGSDSPRYNQYSKNSIKN